MAYRKYNNGGNMAWEILVESIADTDPRHERQTSVLGLNNKEILY